MLEESLHLAWSSWGVSPKNECVPRHSPDRFPSQQDLAELRGQISAMGVHVDVDAPKGHDLAKIMEEMRDKYERIALKNQQELKSWHEAQVGLEVAVSAAWGNLFCLPFVILGGFISCLQLSEVQVQVTESTSALKDATTILSETRRRYQTLEIELQSALGLVRVVPRLPSDSFSAPMTPWKVT